MTEQNTTAADAGAAVQTIESLSQQVAGLQAKLQAAELHIMQLNEEKSFWANQVYVNRGIIRQQPNNSNTPAPHA